MKKQGSSVTKLTVIGFLFLIFGMKSPSVYRPWVELIKARESTTFGEECSVNYELRYKCF